MHGLNATGRLDIRTFTSDNYGWDDNLICGGRVTILAHPLTPNDLHRLRPALARVFV